MSVGSVNTGYSYYVNPNSRTVTSDIKNTAVYDKEVYRAMSSTLRPIEDMANVLNTPLNLASKTSIWHNIQKILLLQNQSLKLVIMK